MAFSFLEFQIYGLSHCTPCPNEPRSPLIMIGNVEVNNFILFKKEDDDRSGILFRIIFSIISCWNFITNVIWKIIIFFILFYIEDHDRSRILFRIIFSIFSCSLESLSGSRLRNTWFIKIYRNVQLNK